MSYQVAKYYDQDTSRSRWAVYDTETRVWYFPKQYGSKATQRLAAKFNEVYSNER